MDLAQRGDGLSIPVLSFETSIRRAVVPLGLIRVLIYEETSEDDSFFLSTRAQD